jgi:hypothetical protein
MASERGRQSHPDYHEIPRALDEACALPTRAEEHQYLTRLIEEIEAKARLYSPLSGIANTRPESTALEPWTDDPALELLIRHRTRQHDTREPAQAHEYSDILTAFTEVKGRLFWAPPAPGKAQPSANSPSTSPAALCPILGRRSPFSLVSATGSATSRSLSSSRNKPPTSVGLPKLWAKRTGSPFCWTASTRSRAPGVPPKQPA